MAAAQSGKQEEYKRRRRQRHRPPLPSPPVPSPNLAPTYGQLVSFADDLLPYPIDEFGGRVCVFCRSEQVGDGGYYVPLKVGYFGEDNPVPGVQHARCRLEMV